MDIQSYDQNGLKAKGLSLNVLTLIHTWYNVY